jgi:hypothetical protein
VRTRRHPGAERPSRRKERFEQRVAELFEFASRPDLHQTCAASRDLLEVSELDLERDCAAADTGVLAVPPHLVHDLSKRIARPIRARRMQVRTPPLYRLAGVAA